jgi:hypothetical protein
VSVVLIEALEATRPTLPVLTRGETFTAVTGETRERGVTVTPSLVPPLPTLEAVVPDGNQPVARIDHSIHLNGHHLDGSGRTVLLHNDRFDIDAEIAASGTGAADRMDVTVPAARADEFPVGSYDIAVRLVMPDATNPRESNRLAVVIAPEITGLPTDVARDGNRDAQITITFTPELRAGQTVSLLLGSEEILPETFTAPTNTLDFIARDTQPGTRLARLRIDGIDSPIVDRGNEPPTFFDLRVNIT